MYKSTCRVVAKIVYLIICNLLSGVIRSLRYVYNERSTVWFSVSARQLTPTPWKVIKSGLSSAVPIKGKVWRYSPVEEILKVCISINMSKLDLSRYMYSLFQV